MKQALSWDGKIQDRCSDWIRGCGLDGDALDPGFGIPGESTLLSMMDVP
jgi:hypothetical protein